MHTILEQRRQSLHPIAPRRRAGGRFVALVDLFLLWAERARQRDALQRLDDRMLRDIGISRDAVQRECEKPFWLP